MVVVAMAVAVVVAQRVKVALVLAAQVVVAPAMPLRVQRLREQPLLLVAVAMQTLHFQMRVVPLAPVVRAVFQ